MSEHDDPSDGASEQDDLEVDQSDSSSEPPTDSRTASENGASDDDPPDRDEQGWELWTKVSLSIAAVAGLIWLFAYLRLGEPSIFVHAYVTPIIAWLTLPVIVWGLMEIGRAHV